MKIWNIRITRSLTYQKRGRTGALLNWTQFLYKSTSFIPKQRVILLYITTAQYILAATLQLWISEICSSKRHSKGLLQWFSFSEIQERLLISVDQSDIGYSFPQFQEDKHLQFFLHIQDPVLEGGGRKRRKKRNSQLRELGVQ